MARTSYARHTVVAGSALALITSIGVVASASPVGAAPSASHTIRAVETEFHIALSRVSVSAGRYTITAVNKGTIQHGLIVNGPGVQDKLIGLVQPGHSVSKVITLRKGTYDVFCPISNHKMKGMNTHLTVS
jgi:uncharacterized cupredoxin-like copper-binding protein